MVGRYSLIVEDDITHEKTIILVKEYDPNSKKYIKKEKVKLSTIDKGTTKFNNEKELLMYFKEAGYINSINASVYIEYKSKGNKRLEIAYSDASEIAYFSPRASTYVDENDPKFQKFLNKFLENMKKGTFYRFIFDYGYMSKYYVKSKIDDYIYGYEMPNFSASQSDFIKKKIAKELSRYKLLRGLVIGTNDYYKLKQDKSLQEEPEENRLVETSDEEINWVFNRGGYEALFNHFGVDRIYSLPRSDLEELGLVQPQITKKGIY